MRTQVPAAVADRSSTSLASPSRRPRSRLIVAAVAGAPLHLKRPLVVLALAAGAALVAPSAASAAASPSARCTDGLTKLELRLGDGIPLPSSYSNPTSSSVTFNLRVASSAFFGPAHVAGSVTLPPHTGRLKSSVLPTYLHTPMGGGQVTIEVRTNRTGAEVVGRCRYQVSLTAPPPVQAGTPRHPVTRWLLQVPVQLCAIEGSQAAGPARPGQTVPAGRLFSTLAAANEIWYPQAQVAFSSSTSSVIPVIADPTPPNGANGELGDLQLDLKVDGLDPAMACVRAWQARWPGRRGIPVVAARAVLGQPATRGFAPPPPRGLQTASHFPGSGARGDALCGAPVRLEASDMGTPFVIVPDREWRETTAPRTLAHELGHNLFLGHGNGLDDDGDGRPAGFAGARRYDQYCDPGWLVAPRHTQLAEEEGVETVCSLMHTSACSSDLRPLQVETARGVARFIPGTVDGEPAPVLASPTTTKTTGDMR